ncbi:O-antigen ligase family protein [Clostridium saccharoperbutylacetonicum]|uniref:O-antigen polymerase n=1 Tax=Clostridium saccharoperbutylacetonicum N1-4(HMT) TaxID=931276 RepID=M1MMG0_9CLOT|nr:O-antigen ligase family protein [Clostridium saccharoperbutylacetonicum]AGF59099.1 O-antigen polymerase [Clostridium saccharoperbutylacetonicum N1-4(HMT)]AQR97768.1 O-antigen ligase [Clostridium saccharoperbutylacetonicum]NRT60113.1 hypothetical protein [Clostridium saccharoperbutylacetonicum]NSB23425.1 hypothetical protein [Clostridium saccharoperbutylacetonicum]NSB33656.1 hypothetical protein [Clostridium saccharoperbutylacetonicum]
MTKDSRITNIVLAILFVIAAVFGVLNGNYLLTAMYIVTVLAVVFIMKYKDIYDTFYAILMVSAFYDYTVYAPRIQSVYMFHVILAAFVLISLYKLFKDREVIVNLNKKVLIIYAIWFAYMCVSIMWSLSKGLAIKYIAIYLMMFAFIISMMIYNINKERINNTINLILFLVSLVVIVGAVEVALGQQLPVRHYFDTMNLSKLHRSIIEARAIVFSYNTNNLAATLAILSPVCLFGIYRFDNILAKVWFTICTAAGFSLVVISTSRTGIVSMGFSLIVFCIYSIFRIRTLKIQAIVFPLILCISFVFLYYNSSKFEHIKPVNGNKVIDTGLDDKINELSDIEYQEGAAGSLNERGTIILDVLNGTIKEKHYLGFGVGNVQQFLQNQGNTAGIYSPHCYPIEILGDFGIPGILLYGVYYLYLLITNLILGIKKKSVMCFAVVAGLIAFAPASFGPSSITYVFSYWILMGFAVACIQVYRNDNNEYRKTSSIKEFKMI